MFPRPLSWTPGSAARTHTTPSSSSPPPPLLRARRSPEAAHPRRLRVGKVADSLRPTRRRRPGQLRAAAQPRDAPWLYVADSLHAGLHYRPYSPVPSALSLPPCPTTRPPSELCLFYQGLAPWYTDRGALLDGAGDASVAAAQLQRVRPRRLAPRSINTNRFANAAA